MPEPGLPLDEGLSIIGSDGLDGGAVQLVDPLIQPDNSARYIVNGDVSEPGIIKKRPGYTLIGNAASSTPVTALAQFRGQGASPSLIRELADATIEQLDDDDTTWSTLKSASSELHPDDAPLYTQIRDEMYRMSQVDPCLVFNGSNWVNQGTGNTSIPQGNLSAWFKGRHFVSGAKDEPDALWFSDSQAPKTFNRRVNRLNISRGDGSKVTGLAQWRQSSLIIMKEDSIHELIVTGSEPFTDWVLQPVDKSIGSVCPPTIGANNRIFFLARDGVRELLMSEQDTSIARQEPLSRNIPHWINQINWKDEKAMALSRLQVFNNRLFVSVPYMNSHTPNCVLVLDMLTGSWVRWTNHNVNQWCVSTISGREKLYFSNNGASSAVYEALKGTTDNGTNIAFEVLTKYYGSREGDLTFQELELDFDNTDTAGTLTVEARIDADGDFTTLVNESDANVSLLGGTLQLTQSAPFTLEDGGIIREKYNIDGKLSYNEGRFIQYRIKESTAAPVRLKKIATRIYSESYKLQEGVG